MRDEQVIVTGASRGIGAAVAVELDRRGWRVAGLSRAGESPAGRALRCDVGDEAALCETLAEVARDGPVAGLVNNAGIHLSAKSAELEVGDYERVMATNATSALIASREVYPHLKARGGGTIVNMGSFFDKFGVPRNLSYTVSKAALGAMARVLAVEWARDGISVLNVAPGYVRTDLSPDFWRNERSGEWLAGRIPLGRPGASEEVAKLVGAIFDEGIPFLTGETIYVDGGQGINH